MKNVKSQDRTLLITLLAVCLVLCALFGGNYLLQKEKNKRLAEEYQTQKVQLWSIPPTATAEDLEALGILNASKLQTESESAFWDFYNREAGCFVFFKEDEEPLTVQLWHFTDNDVGRIQIENYIVSERDYQYQSAISLFSIEAERVQGENGVCELWVHRNGTPKEDILPNWQDYLLYRYTTA